MPNRAKPGSFIPFDGLKLIDFGGSAIRNSKYERDYTYTIAPILDTADIIRQNNWQVCAQARDKPLTLNYCTCSATVDGVVKD